MLVLLSPAKDLSTKAAPAVKGNTIPELLEFSGPLVKKLQGYSAKRLGKLMDIAPALADLNHARYAVWQTPFTTKNATTAIHLFNGEAYRGLNARTLDADDLQFAQRHLRILSGLYGVLRPMDLIQPYRLEMGTKLKVGRPNNLYQYWGDRITRTLQKDLVKSGSKVLINLASNEYVKSVQLKEFNVPVITPVFKDKTPSGYKMLMVFAKQQRGAMTRHIIQHRMFDPEKLKRYNGDGYRFVKEESTKTEWVFFRG